MNNNEIFTIAAYATILYPVIGVLAKFIKFVICFLQNKHK